MPALGFARPLCRTLGRLTTQRPVQVLAGAAALSLVAVGLVVDLPIDATFNALLPRHDPAVKRFQDITQSFGGASNILLRVAGPEDQRGAFLDELDQALTAIPEVKALDSRIDALALEPAPEAIPAPPETLVALREIVERQPALARRILEDPGLASLLEALVAILPQLPRQQLRPGELPLDPAAAVGGLAEAASGRRAALGALVSEQSGIEVDGAGRPVSPDERANLAVIRLTIDGLQTDVGSDLFAGIEALTREVAEPYPELEWGYAGSIAFSYEDETSVLFRVKLISLGSLVMVLLMFLWVQRSPALTALLIVPLGAGLLWTFAFVRLALGKITLTSAIFGVLLFGLAIDFAIHLLVRVHDERIALRRAGQPWERGAAIRLALERTGPGVLTGGLTTALAFLALLVSDQPAAQHLGGTTGVGLIMSLITMLVVLPAAMTLIDRPLAEGEESEAEQLDMRLPSLDSWVGVCARHHRAVLAVCGLLLLGSLALIPFVRFEYDIEKLATKGTRAEAVQQQIRSEFELSSDYGLCVCQDLQQAARVAQELRASPEVARVEAASDLLAAELDPARSQAALDELSQALHALKASPPPAQTAALDSSAGPLSASDLFRVERAAASLLRVAQAAASSEQLKPELRAQAEALAGATQRLQQVIAAGREQAAAGLGPVDAELRQLLGGPARALLAGTARPLTRDDLPRALRDKFFDEQGRTVVIVTPRQSIFDGVAIRPFMDALEQACPGGTTGLPAIARILVDEAIADLPVCLAAAILAVGLLLSLDLRRPVLVLITFAPLVLAATSAVACLVLTGQSMSVIALGALPLIFGIGVDDGVHLVHRSLEGGPEGDPGAGVVGAVSAVGRAILLTSLTTGLSFGGLMLMNHTSIEALGFLVATGVGICFLASVTLFPALVVALGLAPLPQPGEGRGEEGQARE